MELQMSRKGIEIPIIGMAGTFNSHLKKHGSMFSNGEICFLIMATAWLRRDGYSSPFIHSFSTSPYYSACQNVSSETD